MSRLAIPASVPRGAQTLDAEWYVSDDVFARERERVFSRAWCVLGRAEEVASPGDFIVRELQGESVIVTRDARGAARAFYNVCRHRGTRMCTEERGTFKGSIQCPYHAWTYGLDGSLLAARNMETTEGFDRSSYPLHAVSLAEAGGFLFASLDPAEPFDAFIAPLAKRLARWNVEALRPARRIEYDLKCNWKLVFLNYSECYHCPVIHPQLEKLSPSDSGRNDFTEGSILGGYSTLRPSTDSLTTTGHTSRAPVGDVDGEDLARIYYYTIFPTMLLSLHPDYVMAHYVRPIAPDRTHVVCDWLFDARAMAEPGFDASDAVDFWDLTNRQDWHVNELSQLGIASRSYSPGPYSQQEGLLYVFDRHYRQAMGD
jgi:Rieske 2Fe-2S family protein